MVIKKFQIIKKKVHVQIKKSVPFCSCEATWRETITVTEVATKVHLGNKGSTQENDIISEPSVDMEIRRTEICVCR